MWLYAITRSLGALRLSIWLLIACCVLAAPSSAQQTPLKADIRGADMGGYGRIVLNLNALPSSEVRINNSILIWTFDRPLNVRVDKLPIELSQYVAGARLDPDGKTLRLALAQNLRFNLQDAGTDYYLDLLPKSWTAANPPIPADIVRDLSRRVREAEAGLRARDAALEKLINFEGGEGPSLSILRVLAPEPDQAQVAVDKGRVKITFKGRYRIDPKKLSSVLPQSVKLVRASQDGDVFTIVLDSDAKTEIRSHRDDQVLVIEFQNRKSGALDIEDLTIIGRGEWTGSVADSEDTQTPVASEAKENRIRFSDTSNMLSIDMRDDYPVASFVADGYVFLMFATDQSFVIPDAIPPDHSDITSLAPIGSGNLKGVMLGVKAGLFPHISKRNNGYLLAFANSPPDTLQSYDFIATGDSRDQARVIVSFSDAADIVSFDDPETGASYFVVPSRNPGLGMRDTKRFQEFAFEASAQGLVIRKFADDVTVSTDAGAVIVTRPRGLLGVSRLDQDPGNARSSSGSYIKAQYYAVDPDADILSGIRMMTDRVMNADAKDKHAARMRLARHYAAHGLFQEAAASIEKAYAERVSVRLQPQDEIEPLLYRILAGDSAFAFARLSQQDMNGFPDAALMMAYHFARNGQMSEAIAAYRASGSVLASYPSVFVRRILPLLTEAAIEASDASLAANLVTALTPYVDDTSRDMYGYLSARYLDLTGQKDEAGAILKDLAHSHDRAVSVRARLSMLMRDTSDTPEAVGSRIALYQGLQTIWRGDWIEARIVMELAKLSFKGGDWRRGFLAMQTINRYYAEAPGARTLLDTATAQLEQIFDEKPGSALKPIDAVSLFMDFREFMPVGRRGDDVIRKLTDRLVELDLLSQAAELMRYQIDNRLEGAARAMAAPRLAYVYLLDKRPQDALALLNETRMNGLSEELLRARLLLEARARADLGDVSGAYELVEALAGDDVDRLRAEIAWRSKDWKRAAELSELAIGEEWRAPEQFQDQFALYALRAAIGYTLAVDRLSLDRIRGRYAKKFGERPDGAAFRFLTAPTAKRSPFDSEYAASYKGGNALDGFMTYYRENYLDKSAAQRQANAAPG